MTSLKKQPQDPASVKSLVDQTVARVSELPAEQWSAWVTYFLEALDSRAQSREQGYTYVDALYSIRDGVMFWAECNMW